MTTQRIVMPLLNRSVTTFKTQTFYFDDSTYIKNINDEDYAAFFKIEGGRYNSDIKTNTKCIYSEFNTGTFGDYARQTATKIKFVMNNFSSEIPLLMPYAALISLSKGKTRITEFADVEAVTSTHKFKDQAYKIKSGSTRELVSNLYKVVDSVCKKYGQTIFTLDRFNSCLTRVEQYDSIVDITISLESLISGNQDLKFKFALYHSLISEVDPEKRFNAFSLLGKLYDARSKIVHGDADSKDAKKSINLIVENWKEVLRLSKAAINYYLLFLFVNLEGDGRKAWDLHLNRLIYGLDQRIVD
jgi:hypothetical protein